MKGYKLPEDAEKVNRTFFEYSATQGTAYEKITCAVGGYSAVQLAMNARVMDETWGKSPAFRKLSREEQNLVLAFINTFALGCYRQWVADGKRMPLEQVIRLAGLAVQGKSGDRCVTIQLVLNAGTTSLSEGKVKFT